MDSGSFSKLLHLVTTLMAWLSIPVIIVCLYDYFVLKKERPAPQPNVDPPRPPFLIGLAWSALPFVLIAVAIKIGIAEVFGWLRVVAVPLSWLAAPVALWCAIDSWIFAPRRAVAAGVSQPPDPLPLRIAYAVLPVLVSRSLCGSSLPSRWISPGIAAAVTGHGLGVAAGSFVLPQVTRSRRGQRQATTRPAARAGTVDYARSFFPVAFIVLLVRAFIFEPFRIPSDSMMPTLLDGDFIVVSKYSYGLRWPVLNQSSRCGFAAAR